MLCQTESMPKTPAHPAPRKPKPAARARDREATERRLLDAAGRLLADKGFGALGVNAVAAEAGVDKQLIYRYFDGLEGLIGKLGERLDFWLKLPKAEDLEAGSYPTVMGNLLKRYLGALRGNAQVRKILAWELVEDGDLIRRLGASKAQAMGRWFGTMRERAGTPAENVDAAAINAILLAAVHHLALREQSVGTFAGLDLTAPKTWRRIETALAAMLASAHARPPK